MSLKYQTNLDYPTPSTDTPFATGTDVASSFFMNFKPVSKEEGEKLIRASPLDHPAH